VLYNALSGRDIILKASQLGVTSLIMALFLVDCITVPNTTSVVIAHEEFITQRLLAKAKVFEESIPSVLKPKMHHRSAYELAWDEINSTFYIGSARSFVFGRGERIDNALCSEVAFWNNPEKILVPLGERVPLGGRLIIESTPNGEGNYFHSLWLESVSGWETGSTVFKPHFLPWWLSEEYKLSVGEGLLSDQHSPLKLSSEEKQLVRKHKLTEEQIRWRRYKLASLGSMFYQEYPEDDQSCFLAVEQAVFDSDLLNQKLKQCYPPSASYEGALIWQPPVEGAVYIIGADPSIGRVKKAAATVWSMEPATLKLCARYSGVVEPQAFADKLKLLGRYYNNAKLVVESNNPGVAVLGYLMDYPNLYYHRDITTGTPTRNPGWVTTSQSKSYMIQEFRRLLPDLHIPDAELIREARNFRYVGLRIESVGEDDIMMSAMLAIAARDVVPPKPAFIGIAGWKTW